ncbi:ShlB/FhaC/HecB family hemolysin secretion/activation protein [Burkholderia gladioli]|jgi:hemolysin activation/secretion protein|uniref:POTRA domain, ShlB-type family protein n=1 Tax=Burkholderia gladioli TaxID=28095 RepID=A0AAW7R8U2_BURGA|nr:POTRA domain-containing protein [Burkholderia gladioli]AJW98878.1 POTRA domain, ShlB-type family protein [Burkholderia gladioli]ASD79069.1 ShlB/FhaC/HecB family hemolysin secretion/activation protein [Burkholderia gladioli pv. gladioli]AWY55688.1 ShlB/FhaC/HecB family hemolysin secretion/activation protein [Burkholderia gladioli pv. gladioli]KAF1061586.1 Heme/hemopexin transporter protein HuxB [Burkholderia gladioli]KGC09299.1 POTRA domain, ShlB-type family protein [Burkholderia gladioli]
MRSTHQVWTMLFALAATTAGPAHAQSRPAGNPLESLPQINAPQRSTVTVQVEPQAQQVQELLARHLTPSTIRIEGVKSIPFDLVSARFTPLVGKDVTIGQLIETANGVTKLYQERGYALSFAFVPAQTFEDGVVRITVVEGFVSDVQITGKPGAMESKLRAVAAHITADRPLRKDTFERYVNTFGLLPGITVKANVPPPQNTDGATTMTLDVTRKPINISSGIATTNPGVQGVFTVTESGLTSLGEQLSISALAPKGPNNVTYVAASAAVPIGSNGWTARVDATHYRGNPSDNPGLPSYVKRTVVNDKIGISTSYPILLNNQRSLLATVSGYASHSEDNYQNQLGGQFIGLRSQVRVLQAQMDYTAVRTSSVTKLSFNVAKAFDILGASKSGETNIPGTVQNNPASITFVRTGGTVVQSNQWPFKIGTTVQLTGQFSPVSLPTTEQIAFGAQRFALGYEPGETSGDSGWGMSAEINRQFSVGYAYLKSITPYIAYDMARVYLHAGTPLPNRLSSVGIGIRVSDGQHYNLDLNVAKAIGDAPIESASRSPRINASFSYQLN